MMPRRPLRKLRTCTLCALATALALVSVQALADGTGSSSSGGSKKKNTDVPADTGGGGSGFKSAVTDGSTKYAARDFAGAVAAFQKAIEADPKNPLGHYFLGEAQLANNNMTEAEAAWTRASLESADKDPALRARILFVLADLKERQKKWDEAKAAWQVYLDWAAKYPEAKAFTGSGQSRQQMIGAMQKQDQAYAVVRQRIADTKNGNVFTDLTKQPPAAPAPAAQPTP
jgi:tetratricopeptide (TPR) repeat protein